MPQRLWKRTQRFLDRLPRPLAQEGNKHGALLKGLLQCGVCGRPMAVTYTRNGERHYRYYVCRTPRDGNGERCTTRYVAAEAIERSVLEQLRKLKPSGIGKLRKVDAGSATPETAGLRTVLRTVIEAVIYEAATAQVTIRLRTSKGGRGAA